MAIEVLGNQIASLLAEQLHPRLATAAFCSIAGHPNTIAGM